MSLSRWTRPAARKLLSRCVAALHTTPPPALGRARTLVSPAAGQQWAATATTIVQDSSSIYEQLIPGSRLLFENARTAVLSLDPEPGTERPLIADDALHGVDHVLLHWGGGGSKVVGSQVQPLLEQGATATWNPFGFGAGGTGLRLGRGDTLGMLEAVLVIIKPDGGAGPWPPLVQTGAEFAYMADSDEDAPRPRPWTVTTDIAQQVLLENDLVRIWRFELAGHEACHAHQHVYPYFFLNLRDAHTRRLEWSGGEAPHTQALTPSPTSNTAPARKLFWLDTLEGGMRSTHWHGLENVGPDAFRQFIVEFKAGETPELRVSASTARDPTLVYLPGLHGGPSQFAEVARELSWAAPNHDATHEVRGHASVETAAAAVLARHPQPHSADCAGDAGEGLVLCGHSYGGMVALAAARQWLDGDAPRGVRLDGLVLMSTAAHPQSDEVRVVMDGRRQRAKEIGVRAEADASWPLMVHPATEPGLARRIRDERAANGEAAGVDALLRQLDAIDKRPCQHDTLRRLMDANVPVLVIHGQDDALVPVAEAEDAFATLSSCPGAAALAELRVLESTGHFALQERQIEVTRAISTWWRRVRKRKRAEQGTVA